MTTEFKYDDIQNKTLSPETRKALAQRIKDDVDTYCVKKFTGEHRDHLGASVIGQDCARATWYGFRWVKFAVFSGRMLRLFNRGHREEERFVEWLRGIGCNVWEIDPETGKQYRIWGVQGHYGGSQDAAGMIPYFPDLPMLMEFKTHNNKSFTNLFNKGLKISKPQHYAQMCSYGRHYKFKYGLYCAVNKDDDDLHFEVVDLDWNHGNEMINKAQDIIQSQIPPHKISLSSVYFKCKMCPFIDICFNNEPVEINCRSCRYAVPIENAEWGCTKYNQIIPKDFIHKGCSEHISINVE